eukprot:2258088-Rhodomonas_salina.3
MPGVIARGQRLCGEAVQYRRAYSSDLNAAEVAAVVPGRDRECAIAQAAPDSSARMRVSAKTDVSVSACADIESYASAATSGSSCLHVLVLHAWILELNTRVSGSVSILTRQHQDMLPEHVIAKLKRGDRTIVERHGSHSRSPDLQCQMQESVFSSY